MKLQLSGRVCKARKGFTLVELLIVIAIAALVGAGIVALVFQVFGANAGSTNRMTAVKEVENAVHWITRDAQMAQKIGDPAVDFAGDIALGPFPIILTWKDSYDSPDTLNRVEYSLTAGKLQRAYSKDGVPQGTGVVARHMASTNWSYSSLEHALTFQVTATVVGLRTASETRSFQVVVRATPAAP